VSAFPASAGKTSKPLGDLVGLSSSKTFNCKLPYAYFKMWICNDGSSKVSTTVQRSGGSYTINTDAGKQNSKNYVGSNASHTVSNSSTGTLKGYYSVKIAEDIADL